MKIGFLLLSGLLSMAPSAAHAGDDPPNSEFEKRIHKMFELHGEPVPEDKWSQLLGGRSLDSYHLQKGDTLWDLSRTLFGDPNYWPKIWSANGGVTNPHEVVVHQVMHFTPGTAAEPPIISIESDAVKPTYVEDYKEQLTDEEMAEGVVIENENIIGNKPAIPPPSTPPSPLLRNLPGSFRNVVVELKGTNYDKTGVDAGKPPATVAAEQVILPYYIDEISPSGIGEINEVEFQDTVASTHQFVFLHLRRQAKVGEKLTAIYVMGPIPYLPGLRRAGVDSNTPAGYSIETGGVVQVTQEIDGEKGLYRALVIEASNPVHVGSIVTDELPIRFSSSTEGPLSSVTANVIGGELDQNRSYFGTTGVLYLDMGTDAGVKVGDRLAVRAMRVSRKPETTMPTVSRPVGVVKVVFATKINATAVVLNSVDEIHIGDVTGGLAPNFYKPIFAVKPRGILNLSDIYTSSATTPPAGTVGAAAAPAAGAAPAVAPPPLVPVK